MPNKEIVLPLVSIIIPSYNKADYLIEMISCVLNQTYKIWELIIVDDGSDEDNIRKVNDFIRADSRCKFVRRNREPKNGDTCRNIGIATAKGEYIIIFDSDDLISSECIENRVLYMLEHPNCDYASFPFVYFTGDINPMKLPNKPCKEISQDRLLSSLLQANYPFTVWSNIYRRDSIKDIKWDEKVYVYQDFDFMVQCALANLKHEYSSLSTADYYYRQFSDGSNVCGNFISKQKCESTLYLFKKTLDALKRLDDYDVKKDQFKGMVVTHFERLLLGGKSEDINAYLDLCQEYYDIFFLRKLRDITQKSNKKNSKLKKVYVYYYLYRSFRHPRHKVLLLMSIKSLFR